MNMEKKQPLENVRTVSSSDGFELEQQNSTNQSIEDPNWKPGFWIRFPWIGFGALIAILLCCGASVAVLEVSNGQSEHSWPQKFRPNTLLSVANGVSNICFAIAVGNGIAIAWWRKVLKGSSIHDLHRTWAFSSSIKEVVFSIKYFNVVALAALAAKLTIIDSSLMQNALGQYSEVDSTPMSVSNIHGHASTEWPHSTGFVEDRAGDAQAMSDWVLTTYKLWTHSPGIYPTTWTGCENAFCYVSVPGFGFRFDCDDETSEAFDIMQSLKSNSSNGNSDNSEIVFDINFTTVYYDEYTSFWDSAHIHVNSTWVDRPEYNCNKVRRFNQQCRLFPFVIEYPAQLENIANTRTISVGPRKLGKWSKLGSESTVGVDPDAHVTHLRKHQQNGFHVKDRIIIDEEARHSDKFARSRLAGVQLFLQAALGGRATASLDPETWQDVKVQESARAIQYRPWYPNWGTRAACVAKYFTPWEGYWVGYGNDGRLFYKPDLGALINQIMFALVIDVSGSQSGQQPGDFQHIFNGTRYPYAVHYKLHSEYMWGAVAATICCVLLVLPVYWGFWQLGRKVSLNPFEIAHAFRSPVISHAPTAAPEQLMKEVGHQEVRYGPVTLDGETYGRFGVAAPQSVASVPEAGLREALRPVTSGGERPGTSRTFSDRSNFSGRSNWHPLR